MAHFYLKNIYNLYSMDMVVRLVQCDFAILETS